MHCCLRRGCSNCPEQVVVIICLQKTLTLRGTLHVRAQRFLQTDNDLQQMNSLCNSWSYGGFLFILGNVFRWYLEVPALQSKTLCQIFDEYLAGQSDAVGISISSDTFYNYSRALVLLKEYMRQKFDRADIALLELNYSFIDGFSTFLRKEYSQRKNTAVKYLRWLKRMVNMAIANRHLKFDPFINFKVQREVVDKVF